MGIAVIYEKNVQALQETVAKRCNKAFMFLRTWELYPILGIAAFLRLYRIDTVVFVDDNAVVFNMARDAIVHGLWPITSNRASLGILNFPLVVYLFMLPAAISSNPLWAEVMVGLLSTIAVLLAYLFVRRYYGRLAGTLVAFFYATCVMALAYSGEIWPQSVLSPFVILFLCYLFKGVVERRRGWFLPAILLLGVLYQIHGSSLLLAVLLLVSCIFAFKTIRLYEIPLAVVLLGVLCSPYLFWEWQCHFSDVITLFNASRAPVHINLDALNFYRSFLSPYILSPYVQSSASRSDRLPIDPHSVFVDTPLHYLRSLLLLEYALMLCLLLCGVLVTALQVLQPRFRPLSAGKIDGIAKKSGEIRIWLSDFWATPHRQGLFLLLIWQVLLPMLLIRHSIPLYSHYFIIFLPGQFILIGLFISKMVDLVQSYRPQWGVQARYGVGILAACIIGVQLVGSTGQLIDRINGNFNGLALFPAYNDLSSLQHVLQEADQVAQEQHIHRIYLATNYSTGSAMRYLMEQEKTPITAFDDWHCVVLPSASAGPVIFISPSSDPQVGAIMDRYATVKLVDQPRHLANPPFNLFILTAKPEVAPTAQTFTHDIQLLDQYALEVQNRATHSRWLVTHWGVTHTEKPANRTFYLTHFDIRLDGKQQASEPIECSTTSLWTGDQYFTLQSLRPRDKVPTFVTVQAYSFTNYPLTFPLGPLTLSTFLQQDSREIPLQTSDSNTIIKLAVQ
jgi:4-amino-4-deoxy-L-arabinose transferase-like glycosyltransferase